MDNIKVYYKILNEYRKHDLNLIMLLQKIQEVFGFVSEDSVYWFSRQLDIPASKFYGILTFYPKFRLKPTGKNILTVCCGAACHIKGSDKIVQKVRETLSLNEGEDTTPNLQFTVQEATCIGACSVAPLVILNNTVHANMDTDKTVKLLKGFVIEDEYIGY